MDIDYIRLVADEEGKKAVEEEERHAAEKAALGIIVENGDAEDETLPNAFFGTQGNATVAIAKDEEKGNVWKVTPAEGNVWVYVQQSCTYTPGATYKASLDVKLTGTLSKSEGISTSMYCNLKYRDGDGKLDHILFPGGNITISTEDGWKHWEFEFTISADSTERDNDQFAFYANPVDGEGVGFLIDNVKVEKIS